MMNMSLTVPYLEFYNGNKMPTFGLGTYSSKSNEVEEAVKYAIDIGYRYIDTSYFLNNEKEVGKAIRGKIEDGTIRREDIFVATKLWNTFHKEEQVIPACIESLKNLGLQYVDLYLIHFPIAFKKGKELFPVNTEGEIQTSDVDYLDTWKGMEECFRKGLVRDIGISNFNSEQITRLLASATIKPVNNQVELNININQKRLIEFCKNNGITVTSYSPLGRPGYNSEIPNFLENRKAQLGVALIPRSLNGSRIKENFVIFDFQLKEDEMKILESIKTGKRIISFEELKDHKYYPFGIPF
ncbi:1,5-anhydro-D-fructose reductase-like isoform X1 [Belonocnema kinseyi]|uniref:1,5-anhydro-D-fructose reductase-like isoform X1 n=1 Tax=Belonocnema kinseyi TaxID=2817044 RepID=UPI00143D3A97|nr:1,5-anhydro-D-fructose reductase-like isoform X1 [Belonocnema kinseyi]